MSIEAAAVNEPAVDRQQLDGDPRSTPALIVAAVREASAQFADLLRLARIEVRGNLRAVATLAALFGGALLLVLVSLILLLIALRDAIAVLIGSDGHATPRRLHQDLRGQVWQGASADQAAWLKVRASLLTTGMNWLPASHEQACRNGCRWLAYSKEIHELIGRPESEGVAAIRETFERPFSDGSTLFSRYGKRS